MTLDELLLEWSYRLKKGYPDMGSPSDIQVLREILVENDMPADDIIDELEGENTSDDEDGQLRTQLGSHSKKDIINLINKLDLDEKQIKKLYHRVSNFKSYKPILKILRKGKYKELVVKRYSQEVQMLIEDLSPEETKSFLDYLEYPEKRLLFPKNIEGYLEKIIPSDKVPTSVVKEIMRHTTQDEGKRGVGMGELGLSLIFKNIGAPIGKPNKKGKMIPKGDLSLNGEEFEIKGAGATLGEKPISLLNVINKKLGDFGIKAIPGSGTGKLQYCDGEKCNKSEFTLAISETYKKLDDKRKSEFLEIIRDILENDNRLGVEAVESTWSKISWDDPESMQQNIALMNLYRYVKLEEFKHFLCHDYGEGGNNTGRYVYATGTPEQIIEIIRKSPAKFEKLAVNNLRPRIGFQSNYLEEEA
ncbi:MAG: hypothetical protein HN564_07375 [Flavobacteriales bacterium]|jgi:hypothetical protein|nr:hypothetical protein [Flavobacteriales bacterium]